MILIGECEDTVMKKIDGEKNPEKIKKILAGGLIEAWEVKKE
jgi:hypothetical protein